MISAVNVSRWYGQVIGVNDITCEIGPGITALLGMNGAGKTTLIRMITGQLRPTTGDLRVFGLEPFANPDVYRRMGYCPEIDNFYEHYNGFEFVTYLARLEGMNAKQANDRTADVIDMVGMTSRAGRKIAGYSKGMRQRIKLAQAMLHDPDIILLDEPLNGLDPVGRREFMDLLGALAGQGKAIIVSSHILFEVEQMTRSLLLLHRGRLLATGDLGIIRSLIDKHPHQIRIETDSPRDAAALLAHLPNIVSMKFDRSGEAIQLEVREPGAFYDAVMNAILDQGLEIRGISSPDNNLESVFKYLVEA